MTDIPIFDSLTHPMPNGRWLETSSLTGNSLRTLEKSMSDNGIDWALAVGMGAANDSYKESEYAEFVSSVDGVFPVAYLDVLEIQSHSADEIDAKFCGLRELGYVGVKLHPRFGHFGFEHPVLPTILASAHRNSLAVLICTYVFGETLRSCSLGSLSELLAHSNETKVILVHGGGVRLLEYMEIARNSQNCLLDLSFTIVMYEGCSLDLDISYMFEKFDQRICIGSDSPEMSMLDLRRRFDSFASNISREKAQNIAYRNIANFIPTLRGLIDE